jgi:hypothetical protein
MPPAVIASVAKQFLRKEIKNEKLKIKNEGRDKGRKGEGAKGRRENPAFAPFSLCTFPLLFLLI